MCEALVLGTYGKYLFSDQKIPLVWNVRKADNDNELHLILSHLLEQRPFNFNEKNNDWGKCELRDWLNNEFMDASFSKKERAAILKKENAYDAGEYCQSNDYMTIPGSADYFLFEDHRSLRNQLIEGDFKGFWLRDGVRTNRVAYCVRQNNVKQSASIGMTPDEKLSVLPMMWADKAKLPPRKISNTLNDMQQGVLIAETYFYVNGVYIPVYSSQEGEFLYVKNNNHEIIIVKDRFLDCCKIADVVFPAMLDGMKVVGILGTYSSPYIRNIIIEEGIEFIGDEMIYLCANLESLQMPSTLSCFPGSNFIGCPRLKTIDIAKDNEFYVKDDDVVYTKSMETLVKYIPQRSQPAFRMPASVRHIESGAFCETPYLQEVVLSKSMTELDPYAFAFANVDEVFLSPTLKTIGAHAFENSHIKQIKIPESVENIEDQAFALCENLQMVQLPETLTYFGKSVFSGCCILESVSLPKGIKALQGTFFNCMHLKQVDVPESIQIIDEEAFCLKACYQNNYVSTKWLTIYAQPDSFTETWAKQHEIKVCLDAFDKNKYTKEFMYRSHYEDYINAKIGNVITFGTYLQRKSGKYKDPIEWLVLDKKDHHLLVISQNALAEKEYDIRADGSYHQAAAWKDCELSKWLNDDFFLAAFNELEKQCILDTKIQVPSKLFCLSREEVTQYMPTNKSRQAYRTDYNYIHFGLHKEAAWWLRSIEEDNGYIEIVSRDGTLSCCSSNEVYSVRPAMWIDLHKVSQLMKQNNEDYIKQWYQRNNDFLMLQKDGETILNILTEFTIIFEKLAGLSTEDVMIIENHDVRIVSGPAIKNEEAIHILKSINYEYGYLDLNIIRKLPSYYFLHQNDYIDGIIDDETLHSYFESWFKKKTSYYKNFKFDRFIYVINHKVFYADQLLTEKEVEMIRQKEDGTQNQYDVDHDENGNMYWW